MYIPRTLILLKGTKEERPIREDELISLGRVIVLLGEPGIGKTELTKQLAASLRASRVAAGTFCRAADPSIYRPAQNSPIIIDGLDEITAASSEPAIDKILSSLSKLKNPNVIISCRAADWTGATNRAKFLDDYGAAPISVHILPFNREQAISFLKSYDIRIDPDKIFSAICTQGLEDLSGNPLTLRLLAEVWLENSGLPDTKMELLSRAASLLTIEDNDRHDQSRNATYSSNTILEVAGGIFSHLLLSGTVGIQTNNKRRTTESFISLSALNGIYTDRDLQAVIATRLFQPDGEDHIIPVHRVIAEFLAAQWLSRKLSEKLSERRLFQLLQFNSGVPSALRGLHAWLGYFSPQVRERCIRTDPYGFLRYGDTSSLGAQSARHLLSALSKLADEDPYFRSEDWSVRSVAGLARPELKSEIVALITSPKRHIQLSTLVLESLAGSSLVDQIVPELLELVVDTSTSYVERREAAEALANSRIALDWENLIERLLTQKRQDSWRLAVEAVGNVGPEQFQAQTIADALIRLYGLNESERRESRVYGSDYRLIRRTPRELGKSVLDIIAARIADKPRPRLWHPGRMLTSVIERFVSSAIDGPSIEPRRFWSWVSHLQPSDRESNDSLRHIRDYLSTNTAFRREVQRVVIYDEAIENGPWMSIVHDLPRALPGLRISVEDAAFFMEEISTKDALTAYEISLWGDLVRATSRKAWTDEILQQAIIHGTKKHLPLKELYQEITRPPTHDYQAEETRRQQQYEAKRRFEYRAHRDQFAKEAQQILSGQHIGALIDLAKGYLGRYSDLDRKADPRGRLIDWVGEDIADCACMGFVAALSRNDLPDLQKIWSIRAEGKEWSVEPVMLAGIAEVVRSGKSVRDVPEAINRAVLGIWWDMPEFNSTKLGENIEKELEEVVFSDEQSTETFITTIIEAQLASEKQHVSGLYRFVRDEKFASFSHALALKWLRRYPKIARNGQLELIHLLLSRNDRSELVNLTKERINELDILNTDCQQLWLAVAFCISPSTLDDVYRDVRTMPKEMIWAIKSTILSDRTERKGFGLPVDRYEAIVETFARQWPMVRSPAGGWGGDQNPWDASEFISYCINAIGADDTVAGSEALERLAEKLVTTNYLNHLKHVAQEQRRNRRDQEYPTPTFAAVKAILANAEPTTVDDLKAVILDHLIDLQKYVRDADTGGCEAFWEGNRPKIENVCRDRLLDLIRPRVGVGIELFPELPMPDQNRVDIYVSIPGAQGLPIEFKGQWHSEVWSARKTQLEEKYARDWRTDGRGIYVVLWFGNVIGKNLPKRPDGKPNPSTPSELLEMLTEDLAGAERSRISVVVFDVSIPSKVMAKSKSRKSTKKKISKTC